MNTKTFFCKYHNTYFTNICLACIDSIFHSGFGMEYTAGLMHIPEDYTWDDTYEFIQKL